ncbi:MULTISPECIES: hypothetical protein [Exiguobacterium]|nr:MULTISPECIES: hypothetical protein [Exiguobacterium]
MSDFNLAVNVLFGSVHIILMAMAVPSIIYALYLLRKIANK